MFFPCLVEELIGQRDVLAVHVLHLRQHGDVRRAVRRAGGALAGISPSRQRRNGIDGRVRSSADPVSRDRTRRLDERDRGNEYDRLHVFGAVAKTVLGMPPKAYPLHIGAKSVRVPGDYGSPSPGSRSTSSAPFPLICRLLLVLGSLKLAAMRTRAPDGIEQKGIFPREKKILTRPRPRHGSRPPGLQKGDFANPARPRRY
jgi:hypothetical protein